MLLNFAMRLQSVPSRNHQRASVPVRIAHVPSGAVLPASLRPSVSCSVLLAPEASLLSNGRDSGSHGMQHASLLHGFGTVGEVSPTHLPWLLRLSHVRAKVSGGDSGEALQV